MGEGSGEKESLRKSLLRETGGYYLRKDNETKTFISGEASLEEAGMETGDTRAV